MKTAEGSLRPVLYAVAAFVAVYVALDLNRLYALRYGADLGTFLQTVANMRHGTSWNFGEWRSHLAVHDSWMLGALIPLVALFPRAETMIVVQVVAIAVAAIPLALFAKSVGLPNRAANALGIAYLLTPSAQGLAYDNFSENVFVPALAFALALAVRERSLLFTALAAQALMGIKEDQIAFVAWFALFCAVFWDRRIGAIVFVLALLNGAAFAGWERLAGEHPNIPHYALEVHDVSGKFTLVALLLAPFAFAPAFVGRWLLLALPLLAEIVFAQQTAYEPSRIGSHYTASLLACAAIAAAFGMRRYPALARAAIPCALVVTLLIFSDTVLRPGRWPYIVDWDAYARAVAVRETTVPITLPRREEGVWAVAAANPLVRLEQRPDPLFVACPAYDTDAAAFFQSLGIGERGAWHLCGGVPIRSRRQP